MKKLVSFLIIIAIFVNVTYVYGQEDRVLDFNAARITMINNSSAMKDIRRTVNSTYKQYTDTLQDVKDLNTVKTTVTFMGEKHSIYFDNRTKMMLEKQKEMMPLVMENYWLTTKETETTIKNSLVQGLRGFYLMLYNAQEDLSLKDEKYQLQHHSNQQDYKRYNLGLISRIELDESDFNLLEAQTELNAAKRNYENALRSFNNYIGVPLDTTYDDVKYVDVFNSSELKDIGYYLSLGLKARSEIRRLERQIVIKEKDREISERYGLHEIYPDLTEAHENLVLEIEKLNVDLEKEKVNIEKEIRNAYLNVDNERKNIIKLSRSIELQKNNLGLMKSRYEAGYVTANTIDQLETAVKEMENMYRMAVYNYNTQFMKLSNAIGAGPAYN